MKPYTYLIKHKPTDTVYYGLRSANKQEPHKDLWHNYFTSSPKVKQLISETGVDSFDVEVRKIFETTESAVKWKTKVLRRCKVLHNDKWINQNIAGYIIPSAESNKKISDFHKGKPKSDKHKQKLRESNLGKNKGRVQTEEHRKKNSEKNSGVNNPRYGAIVTEETRRKISEANKGRPKTEEFKKLMSGIFKTDKNPGKNKSPETITKLKEARAKQVMKPRSEESKAKTKAALKAYWEQHKTQKEQK